MSSTALKRKSTVVEDLLASESDEEEEEEEEEEGDANANDSSDDAPELAAHEKTRATKKKAATKSDWHRGGVRTSKEPSIPVSDRLSQFPVQSFEIFGKPFCSCCKLPLSMIKSTINTHIATSKHTENLVKYNERVAADSRPADSISDYYTVKPKRERC